MWFSNNEEFDDILDASGQVKLRPLRVQLKPKRRSVSASHRIMVSLIILVVVTVCMIGLLTLTDGFISR